MLFFLIWFIFMMLQLVYIGAYKVLKGNPFTWNQFGWYWLGCISAGLYVLMWDKLMP